MWIPHQLEVFAVDLLQCLATEHLTKIALCILQNGLKDEMF